MTAKAYNQILTQLVRGYKFVMKDNWSVIQLRVKTIGAMP